MRLLKEDRGRFDQGLEAGLGFETADAREAPKGVIYHAGYFTGTFQMSRLYHYALKAHLFARRFF